MTILRIGGCAMLFVMAASLSGCGDSGLQEVKQWMAEEKSKAHVTIPKLAEPKKFVPFAYDQKDATDPFNQIKLTVALAKLQGTKHSVMEPDRNRRHELLESYPLDAIVMVGSLKKAGTLYGIVRVDKAVFHVKVGNYLGQNEGEIKAITESQISIAERVQDATDEWVERKTTLELQETKK